MLIQCLTSFVSLQLLHLLLLCLQTHAQEALQPAEYLARLGLRAADGSYSSSSHIELQSGIVRLVMPTGLFPPPAPVLCNLVLQGKQSASELDAAGAWPSGQNVFRIGRGALPVRGQVRISNWHLNAVGLNCAVTLKHKATVRGWVRFIGVPHSCALHKLGICRPFFMALTFPCIMLDMPNVMPSFDCLRPALQNVTCYSLFRVCRLYCGDQGHPPAGYRPYICQNLAATHKWFYNPTCPITSTVT